jgi:hypothetical protein
MIKVVRDARARQRPSLGVRTEFDVKQEGVSRPRIDVRLTHGAEGSKVMLSCSDRTAVVSIGQMLPALRSLTNSVVDAAVHREEKARRKIS